MEEASLDETNEDKIHDHDKSSKEGARTKESHVYPPKSDDVNTYTEEVLCSNVLLAIFTLILASKRLICVPSVSLMS